MSKKRKILVIDDEEDVVEELKPALEAAGWEVGVAHDGQEGLNAVNRERPDIVLLDIMMADITGYQVCQKLKANAETRTIPIIIASALANKGDKIQGLEVGADDYVTKPFDMPELLQKINVLLGG